MYVNVKSKVPLNKCPENTPPVVPSNLRIKRQGTFNGYTARRKGETQKRRRSWKALSWIFDSSFAASRSVRHGLATTCHPSNPIHNTHLSSLLLSSLTLTITSATVYYTIFLSVLSFFLSFFGDNLRASCQPSGAEFIIFLSPFDFYTVYARTHSSPFPVSDVLLELVSYIYQVFGIVSAKWITRRKLIEPIWWPSRVTFWTSSPSTPSRVVISPSCSVTLFSAANSSAPQLARFLSFFSFFCSIFYVYLRAWFSMLTYLCSFPPILFWDSGAFVTLLSFFSITWIGDYDSHLLFAIFIENFAWENNDNVR